jgi:hypothetical protein
MLHIKTVKKCQIQDLLVSRTTKQITQIAIKVAFQHKVGRAELMDKDKVQMGNQFCCLRSMSSLTNVLDTLPAV